MSNLTPEIAAAILEGFAGIGSEPAGADLNALPVEFVDDYGHRRVTPMYRLLAQQMLGDDLFDRGAEIEWRGEPNMDLQPLNKAAGDRWNEWFRSLPFAPDVSALEALAEVTVLLRGTSVPHGALVDLPTFMTWLIGRVRARRAVEQFNKQRAS